MGPTDEERAQRAVGRRGRGWHTELVRVGRRVRPADVGPRDASSAASGNAATATPDGCTGKSSGWPLGPKSYIVHMSNQIRHALGPGCQST